MRAAKLLLSAPLLLCLAWGAPSWAQAPAAGMKIVQIMDMQGFGQPVVAAMAHIPASWQTQGGVNWDRRTPCVGNQLKLEWTTQSPDGQQAVELMHGFSWQVQGTQISMNPCPVMGLRSTREFLQAVAQQRRPGAQIGAYRDRADIAQAAQKAAKVQPGVQLRVDAGELELAYRAGNTLVREVLSSSVTFTQMQGNVVAGTAMVLAQRAPQDRFDPQMATRITASLQTNPHWIEMSTGALSHAERQYSSAQRQAIDRWHATEMARINAQGAADRAAIRAQTQREVGQIQSQTYNNTQATNDRMHRRNMEGVGEYNTYRDSSGNTVRSSIHGGERVLRHGDGSYSSTNNPYYNPAGSQELQRVK